jgi:hypothetical protein
MSDKNIREIYIKYKKNIYYFILRELYKKIFIIFFERII